MATQTIQFPLLAQMAGFHRFSLAKYHQLIDIGLLTEADDLELLEGYLVNKMAKNPPHESALDKILELLFPRKPAGWMVRMQEAVTLSDSEPEPDFAVVRGKAGGFSARHPGPAEIGLVIEVADSTLDGDRADKCRIYARAALPEYWIVNIPDSQVEVYTSPSGPCDAPGYAHRQDYRPGDAVPFRLDGALVAALPVSDMLP